MGALSIWPRSLSLRCKFACWHAVYKLHDIIYIRPHVSNHFQTYNADVFDHGNWQWCECKVEEMMAPSWRDAHIGPTTLNSQDIVSYEYNKPRQFSLIRAQTGNRAVPSGPKLPTFIQVEGAVVGWLRGDSISLVILKHKSGKSF